MKKLLLALSIVSLYAYADLLVENDSSHEVESELRGHKCKNFSSINVCGNAKVGGTVTANSFVTPSGALFNGLRNYAVLSNQAAVTNASNFLWAATSASSVSLGISFNATTGAVTLPTTGIFLVIYSVRLNRTPFDSQSSSSIQLQQTVAGVPTNITQPAITINSGLDGITEPFPLSQPELTGYAVITTSSASNNTINLFALINDNVTIPATTGTDANAQMVILQLN